VWATMALLGGIAARERQRHHGAHRPHRQVRRVYSQPVRRMDNPRGRPVLLVVVRWLEAVTGGAHRASERALITVTRRMNPQRPVSAEWVKETREHILKGKTERITEDGVVQKFSDH